ncbi:hypothetical protein [Ramlibacter sp.]|uniref:hypothetical protein n=1 Tax=Ramlibacter sp. TaxID=1917967 RepID=UPI002D676BAE|nr:hypothetical protein [Ramlibacter sp.]HYD77951.1 hypothetical protein [Ramlibacter sp.]
MARSNDTPSGTRTRYRFYAAGDRLYARNVAGKVVDLGRLTRHADGSWHYFLDGNQLAGGGTPTPETAMVEAARRMGFLYLDGQFTAVEDARTYPDLDLDRAPAVEIDVDELQPGERMEDARV